MKTAVCMYGLLRTYKITAPSLIRHVLEINNADLYIFAPNVTGISNIRNNIDINEYKRSHKKEIKQADCEGELVTEDDLRNIFGKYLKKAYLYNYNSKKFDKEASNFQGNGIVSPSRIFSMFYNLTGAANLVISAGVNYDKVILLRPDLAFYSDISLERCDMEKVHIPFGGGKLNDGKRNLNTYMVGYYKNTLLGELIPANKYPFTDQFIVVSGKYINSLLIYNKLTQLIEQGLPIHPETLLYYSVVYRNHLAVKVHSEWLYEIFRNGMNTIENDDLLQISMNNGENSSKLYHLKKQFKWKVKEYVKYAFPCYRKLCQIHETLLSIQQNTLRMSESYKKDK